MAGTRSSSRLAANSNGDSPNNSETGSKRKADAPSDSTQSKRGKKEKGQQTLEQTGIETEETEPETKSDENKEDTQMSEPTKGNMKPGSSFEGTNKHGEPMSDPEKALKESRGGSGLNALNEATGKKHDDLNAMDVDGKPVNDDMPHDDVHRHDADSKPMPEAEGANSRVESGAQAAQSKKESKDDGPQNNTGDAIEEDKERAEAQPSNILEKGVIYFFTRGRVGVEDMESVQDIQRSYFVLRPIPEGGKLTDGNINDLKNNRLIALPKKVWPKSPKDRFMAFVEKAKTTVQELKDEFFQGSEYSTKTTGVRQTPPVTVVGEGVYAITSTGNRGESHLAYMLTIPRELGNIQSDMGLASQGSFLMSLKNPNAKSPANAALPQKPDYPKEFDEEFRGRGWMPAEPKHLDYANAQVLLIGHSDSSNALEATKKDQEDDSKETPQEEMEKLEHEDDIRVKHLSGDDTVFGDLGISKKDYPDVATTW